jgi:hypothetical protein
MIHAGGNHVERPELTLVETPPPEVDTGWTPIPHDVLVDQVTDSLAATGYDVVNEAHALAREGQQYFGMMQVSPQGLTQADDYSLVIGLRNSHNKSFSAGLVCGSGVFVCDNLAFSGEIKIGRKHIRFITRDLPGIVHAAVGKLGDMRMHQDQRIAGYKTFELTDNQADHLIVQMLRDRIITTQQVIKVVNEWDAPSHPEFSSDGKTGWRLFNAVTEASKGRLAALPRATQALHGMMDTVCGVTIEGEAGRIAA